MEEMINPNTGNIEFSEPPVSIKPSLSLSAFLSSPLGITARLILKNGPWSTFSVFAKSCGQDFAVTLIFSNNMLLEAHIAMCWDGDSWKIWSEKSEHEKKLRHDSLLAEDIGTPPYNFPWGSVDSIVDPKTGGSSILVHYRSE